MIYRGKVTNGVVVLEGEIRLPEGSVVLVEPLEAKKTDSEDPLYRLFDLAVPTGMPDLAVNIDHYLYGHPKVTDGGQ